MLEIKFSGRGGQGVVLASQMLGLAFFKADKYPQCYSVFGGERRGAPLVSFLRVDKEKILLKCEIEHPSQLICFDDSIVDPDEIKTMLAPGGQILINTRRPPEDFAALADFKTYFIDAYSISTEVGLGKIFNTAMIGAYCRFMGQVAIEHVAEAVAELAPVKHDANVAAARKAYEVIQRGNHDPK